MNAVIQKQTPVEPILNATTCWALMNASAAMDTQNLEMPVSGMNDWIRDTENLLINVVLVLTQDVKIQIL